MRDDSLPDGWLHDEMVARGKEKLVYLSADILWDVLREVACSTRPSTDAKCIVTLRRDHVVEAIRRLPGHTTINGPVA